MATSKSVRQMIEAAKVELMALQHDGMLGEKSMAKTVETFAALDQAWALAYQTEKLRELGF